MKVQASKSEDNGIAALSDNATQVLSVGISTGGIAEIRMAEQNPKRHIVATTIDREGVNLPESISHKKVLASR